MIQFSGMNNNSIRNHQFILQSLGRTSDLCATQKQTRQPSGNVHQMVVGKCRILPRCPSNDRKNGAFGCSPKFSDQPTVQIRKKLWTGDLKILCGKPSPLKLDYWLYHIISCSPCSLHFLMPRSKNCGALSSDTPVVAVGRSAASGTPVVGFVGRNPSGAPNDQTESLVVEKDLWLQCSIFSYLIESCLFFLDSQVQLEPLPFTAIKRSKIVREIYSSAEIYQTWATSMSFIVFHSGILFISCCFASFWALHWSVPNHQLARVCSGVAALRRRNTGHCQHLWVKRWSRHLSQAQLALTSAIQKAIYSTSPRLNTCVLYTSIYIYIYICESVYIQLYIYLMYVNVSCIHIHIYVYIHILCECFLCVFIYIYTQMLL